MQQDYFKKQQQQQPAPTELINEWCYVGTKHSLSQVSGMLRRVHSGANH